MNLIIFFILFSTIAIAQIDNNSVDIEATKNQSLDQIDSEVPLNQNLFSGYNTYEISYIESEERLNCVQEIDLREEFHNRGLPDRRHQDTTGWCYAFVGADLVSYELGFNVSPADMANQYLERGNIDHLYSVVEGENPNPLALAQPLGGGFTGPAINLTNEIGFCSEQEVPSQDYARSVSGGLSILTNEVLSPNHGVDKSSGQVPSEICIDHDRLREIYNIPIIDDLLNIVQARDFKRILNNISSSEGCLSRTRLPDEVRLNSVNKEIVSEFENSKNNDFYSAIDNAINSNRPVSIAVDNSIFNTPIRQGFVNRPNAQHQVIISGKRFNEQSGRCEYLVRNSESSCRAYSDEYECENNHIWIPRKIVRMGSVSADFFSN